MEVETRWQQLSEAGPLSLLHDEATPGPLPISRGKEGRPCRLGIRTPDCSPSWLTLTWWQVGKRLTILDLLSANYIKTIFATEMWGIKCYKRFSKGPWWKSMGCCHHPGLSKEGMAVLLFFSNSLSLKCTPATVVGMFFPFSLALFCFWPFWGVKYPQRAEDIAPLMEDFCEKWPKQTCLQYCMKNLMKMRKLGLEKLITCLWCQRFSLELRDFLCLSKYWVPTLCHGHSAAGWGDNGEEF